MAISDSRLIEVVKPLYEGKDPAHRFDHIERMLEFCNKAGAALEADVELLRLGALVHGLKRGHVEGLKDILGEGWEDVFTMARNASKTPNTLEERILWDANILDALGSIGLARAFTKGGHEGQTIDETVRIVRENMRRPLHTPVGRAKAEPRLGYMMSFLRRLEGELVGT